MKQGVYSPCLVCGKTFYSKPSETGKYCSVKCYQEVWSIHTNPDPRPCKTCKKVFQGSKNYHQVFCSKKCKFDYYREERHEINIKKYGRIRAVVRGSAKAKQIASHKKSARTEEHCTKGITNEAYRGFLMEATRKILKHIEDSGKGVLLKDPTKLDIRYPTNSKPITQKTIYNILVKLEDSDIITKIDVVIPSHNVSLNLVNTMVLRYMYFANTKSDIDKLFYNIRKEVFFKGAKICEHALKEWKDKKVQY